MNEKPDYKNHFFPFSCQFLFRLMLKKWTWYIKFFLSFDWTLIILSSKLFLHFRWKIRVGSIDLTKETIRVLEIVNSHVHPKYNGKSSYFDIAVLETEEIEISNKINPVCLPESISYDINEYKNDQAQLLGWGSEIKNGKPSNTLKRVNVKVLSQR